MTSPISRDRIFERAHQLGANLYGIADLSAGQTFIQEIYGDFYSHFPRAVSAAIYFPKEIVQEQLLGPTRSYNHYYRTLNRQLDSISLIIAGMLQSAGFRAYPIAASDYRQKSRGENLQRLVAESDIKSLPKIGTERMGQFSHRLAAREAGLGWIGKNCSLINPEVGPRLRLTTILTDAPLPADAPMPDRCGNCMLCLDACPAQALTGRRFDPADTLADRFDSDLCNRQLDNMGKVFGQSTCALCLAACPWGQK